jgi:uncharacterized protein YqjF (DUF2071 family)/predicted DCC family thiol-disulfide oxidoreductase YuxK
MAPPFLSAFWRNLIVINYEVDPSVLRPLLPLGTELDLFENKALMSVIAFNFEHMKLFGTIPTIPVTNFEELNLRFYVRRTVGDEVRRGVVFVKEVVPSALIAATARVLYNEPYEARPMTHSFAQFHKESGGHLSYETQVGTQTVSVHATTEGELRSLQAGSIEHFILEHYWGYTKQNDGTTSEYRVQHEPWSYWQTKIATVTGDIAALYPDEYREALAKPPHSTFVARGSSVKVFAYQRFSPTCSTAAFPRSDARGYLLYDGGCGFCSWWVSKMTDHLAKVGIAVEPLQSAWVADTIQLPAEEVVEDIRLILADGTLRTGANVYVDLLKRMRWTRPLGIIMGLPGIRSVTWGFYRLINRNRFMVSRVCRLEPYATARNTSSSPHGRE